MKIEIATGGMVHQSYYVICTPLGTLSFTMSTYLHLMAVRKITDPLDEGLKADILAGIDTFEELKEL